MVNVRGWSAVLQAILLLAAPLSAQPPAMGQEVAGRLELYRDRIVVGEPLLITAVITNQGKGPVVSTLALPGYFQQFTMASFVIREVKKGTEVARLRWDRNSGVENPPKSLTGDRLKKLSVMPGASVKARKVLCVLTAGRDYLGPGEYTIEAAIDFKPFWAAAAKTPFTIQPLAKGDEDILQILLPQKTGVISLLEGNGDSTPELRSRRDKLRKSFAKSPHRMYFEFALLRDPVEGEEEMHGPAVEQYIKDYPKSPFIDELLYYRAVFEFTRKNYAEAASDLKKLFKEYPDSLQIPDARLLMKSVE